MAINAWAVALLRYEAGVLKRTKEELREREELRELRERVEKSYVNYVMPWLCSCIQLLKLLLLFFFFSYKKLSLSSDFRPRSAVPKEAIKASGLVDKESCIIAEE